MVQPVIRTQKKTYEEAAIPVVPKQCKITSHFKNYNLKMFLSKTLQLCNHPAENCDFISK